MSDNGEGVPSTPSAPVVAEPSEEAIRKAPFSVAMLTGNGENDQKPQATVFGQTYGASIALRAYGGRFDKDRKMWVFPDEPHARAAVHECGRLYVMGAAQSA